MEVPKSRTARGDRGSCSLLSNDKKRSRTTAEGCAVSERTLRGRVGGPSSSLGPGSGFIHITFLSDLTVGKSHLASGARFPTLWN